MTTFADAIYRLVNTPNDVSRIAGWGRENFAIESLAHIDSAVIVLVRDGSNGIKLLPRSFGGIQQVDRSSIRSAPSPPVNHKSLLEYAAGNRCAHFVPLSMLTMNSKYSGSSLAKPAGSLYSHSRPIEVISVACRL